MIVATRDFRRIVNPRRGHALAKPRRADPAADFREAKEAWARTRTHWVQGWELRKDALVEVERAADAILGGDKLPDAIDPLAVAAAERMLSGQATLVGCVAARAGAAEALRTKVQSTKWNVVTGRRENVWWWSLAATESPAHHLDDGWRALRRAACAASDASYAEALAIGRALREAEKTPEARARLDFVFPGEPAWAAADLDAMLASPQLSRLVHVVVPLLASIDDEGPAARCIGALATGYQSLAAAFYACDLVAGLSEEGATRVLAALAARVLATRRHEAGHVRPLAVAMSAIRSEAMATELARWLRHPRFGRWIASYFEGDDALARFALGPIAAGKSLAADGARAILAANARAAEPDEGDLADAPPLLASPPWAAREKREPLAMETLPWDATIAWAPGERERLLAAPLSTAKSFVARAIDASELAQFDELPDAQKYVEVWPRWENKKWTLLELPEDRVLALWDAGRARLYLRPPTWMLARFGERAIAGLFARDPFDTWDERYVDAYLRVVAPKSALVAARLFARRRAHRARARAWLLDRAEVSAIAVIPVALGREGRAQRVAMRALRLLAFERPAIVREIARRYGPAVDEVVRELLFGDPLARIDARGTTPKWLRLASLPMLRTRSGRPLPRAATATLVDALRCRGEDVPWAGLDVLREALDPASLDALAWALFSTWVLHGGPRTHVWMAHALAAFPREDTALRIQPWARDLATTNARACAVVIDVLAAVGDDAARMVLEDLASFARVDAVKEALAQARGTGDEPFDLGLDARGEASFDLGGRTARVVLDESLVPFVVLDDGRRLPQMPRAAKNDDPARVAAATARFRRLRRAAHTRAKTEVARLERAMCTGKRFVAADLRARWARDVLLAILARRLVWGVWSGPVLAATFRVAEDGTLADEGDLPLALDDDASVGVVHPLDLDADTRARWSALFGDYEIVQPFEQLGRAAFAGTPDEAARIVQDSTGATIHPARLLATLAAHGWTSSGHRVTNAWRDLRGENRTHRATLTFAPGIDLGAVRAAPAQKITALRVADSPSLAEIDRVDRSELVRTALALRA